MQMFSSEKQMAYEIELAIGVSKCIFNTNFFPQVGLHKLHLRS